ncbi:MAG TPA: tRNA preQ1(34) S-adenosylmethionine ribosyltransferase-isomerase QueA [Thermoanaerobaculia bacterium]|nr:tRNA preQ1(34) S-adenosylmethionine ribosyltransferase-isomerase QueA [Thermoanaerobaculia bacterium]
MKVELFDYLLPADRIAQTARPRGTSRLLVLNRTDGSIRHRSFSDFPELLREGDVLVRNDVRVRPARLWGRDEQDRVVEIFLLEDAAGDSRRWTALAKPGRRAKAGREVRFAEGVSARVEAVQDDGRREVLFDREMDDALLERIGNVPLPPYIRREAGVPDRPEDRIAYQTVFAREPRAVAAPTAGLHFTPEVLERIERRGVTIADLTLSIGAATFKPVTVEETAQHRLDAENAEIPAATVREVSRARAEGRRVVATGTTATRALEAAARLPGGFDGTGDLSFAANVFITPGFEFRAVDALLTNFHLPRSTLLMLVCAFAGREKVLAAYDEAIREGYLFYSYGDAMFIADF